MATLSSLQVQTKIIMANPNGKNLRMQFFHGYKAAKEVITLVIVTLVLALT